MICKNLPLKLGLLVLMVLGTAIGCGSGGLRAEEPSEGSLPDSEPSVATTQDSMSSMFRGTVVDVIDAGRYVYLQVATEGKKVWVAAPTFEGKVGDTVLVPPGVPMANFHSKKLDREFDMIYFVGGVRRAPEEDDGGDAE